MLILWVYALYQLVAHHLNQLSDRQKQYTNNASSYLTGEEHFTDASTSSIIETIWPRIRLEAALSG